MLVLLALGVAFVYVSRSDATTFARGFLAFRTDMWRYTHAIVNLADDTRPTAGIITASRDLFVVSVTDRRCTLLSCLWQNETERLEAFSSFRSWVAERDYLCSVHLSGADLDDWQSSSSTLEE